MNEIQQIRFLSKNLQSIREQAENTNTALIDIIGDKCRSCKMQRDCWKTYHFVWLTEVALKGGEEWECANYKPLSCASVIGRPFTIRAGGV